jgi:teichuronic acid biosynthesis glycosyltransferase TuaG
MTNPTVSVVIPLHNSASTIERCIRSVIEQTLPPLEIIAVDDASTDSTCETIERLASTSPIPIRLERLQENLGPGITRNTGWDVARGDLIAFLDADDAWHPRKLEIQVRVMADHPNVVMSCHRHSFSTINDWEPSPSPSHRTFGLRSFLVKNRCSTPSVMLRRDIPARSNGACRTRRIPRTVEKRPDLTTRIRRYFTLVDRKVRRACCPSGSVLPKATPIG